VYSYQYLVDGDGGVLGQARKAHVAGLQLVSYSDHIAPSHRSPRRLGGADGSAA
jgi:hypothetical protein